MNDFAAEFFGCPEYVITDIRIEKLKNGSTRVYYWVERNGVKVPQFMVMVAATDLAVMCDIVQESLNASAPLRRASH